MTSAKPETIDAYISTFPAHVQQVLQEVRQAIKEVIPTAEETIKYAIPTFMLHRRNLVHFAAFKNHIGFYPTPTGIESFEEKLAGYKQGKGSVQFPLDKPMPLQLIKEIVASRLTSKR